MKNMVLALALSIMIIAAVAMYSGVKITKQAVENRSESITNIFNELER